LAKTYPRHALLLNELGTLHFFNNEPNLALMYFERAVEANPELLNARRNLIDIYKMLGCLQEALQHLSYIIDHHPEDVEALLNLAHICESLERFDDALVFYGRLKELLPDNPEISQKIMEIVVKQNEGAESTTEENTLQNSHSIQESDKKGTPERHSASLPKVSIIIPVYNRLDMTRQCVDAIYSTLEKESKEIPFEIIVVDNNSTDGTLEFLEEKSHQHDNFYYLRFHNNTGFAHACNTGAYYAKGEYLLFLNNDTQPLDGWLSPLVQTLDVDKEVVATGSKLIYPDGTVQHAGVAIYDDRTVGDPLLPKHLHVGLAAEAKEVNEALTCKALTAACLMVRRKTFQEVGGFDEEYYNGYEDVDLCFKLFREGWKLVYQPRSCVVHFESQSGPERFRKVKENISRLHHQWLGKIQPDIVVQKNGKEVVTKHSVVRPYHLPGVEQTQQPGTEAKKETVAVEAPLTSIVILTYNQLHRTRECLESIVKHTREPYEVIVVDNGSSDGTVDYLRNWTKKHRNFRAIFNKTNKGFAAGNNQGIKKAKGDYIVLLNNDVVVSENWLEGMRKAFDKSPAVGLVGPMTNYISGHQLEPAANYQSLKEFEVFTREYSLAHKNQYVETFRLVGFCLMIKREVIDKIGLLDESFGLGNFEDDDFCLRASLEGYQLVIAREVFVHHYGNSSFKGNNIDYQKLLEKNRSIFLEKWKNLNIGNPLWIAHLVEKARLEEQAGNYEAQRWALEKAFSLNPENRQ
ncbi:MAG: glycosyltransferase, partial [Methanobacteriota archaeon]